MKKVNLIILLLILFTLIGSVSASSIESIEINDINTNGDISTYSNDITNISSIKNDNTLDNIIDLGDDKEIYIQNASYYNTSDLNSYIQDILNNASEGSTIKFLGSEYNDLHLVINNPLNIIGSNTLIHSTNGNPVFNIHSSASGSNISGFIIESSSNGIYGNGVNDISIANNTFKTTSSVAIRILNSKNVNISKNKIYSSSKAIYLSSSEGINILNNIISKNNNDGDIGIQLSDCNGLMTTIKDNNISGFDKGISTDSKVSDIIIKGNNIFNCYNGINLDSGISMSITNNSIHNNYQNGILLNGKSIDLSIKSNTLVNNGYTGLNFGSYDFSTNNGLSVSANYFAKNSHIDIESANGKVNIGSNVANNVCPHVSMKNSYKMIVKKNGNKYEIGLYNKGGSIASDVPTFTALINTNGKFQYVTFVNGKATFTSQFESNDQVEFNYASQNYRGTLDESLSQLEDDVKFEEVAEDYFNPEPTPQPTSKKNNGGSNTNTNSSGTSSGNSFVSGNSISNDAGSGVSSGSSSASSSASASSTGAIAKTLSVDDEIFRVAGVGGLLVLIILVIGLYYSRDIYKLLRKNNLI